MEKINEAIAKYTAELERVNDSAPEHGAVAVAIKAITGTPADSVNLKIAGEDESEVTDKVIGEDVELALPEGAETVKLVVTCGDATGEVPITNLMARGAEVDVAMGGEEGPSPAKVTLLLKKQETKQRRMEQLAQALAQLKTEKNSLKARQAAAAAAAEANKNVYVEMAGWLAMMAWQARGFTLFGATVAMLHYRGDYLAM